MSRERWIDRICWGFLGNISRGLAQDTTCPVHVQMMFAIQVVQLCFGRLRLEGSRGFPALYATILRAGTVANLQRGGAAQSCSLQRRRRARLNATCSCRCPRIEPKPGGLGLDVNK
jgi:hypothetical protein